MCLSCETSIAGASWERAAGCHRRGLQAWMAGLLHHGYRVMFSWPALDHDVRCIFYSLCGGFMIREMVVGWVKRRAVTAELDWRSGCGSEDVSWQDIRIVRGKRLVSSQRTDGTRQETDVYLHSSVDCIALYISRTSAYPLHTCRRHQDTRKISKRLCHNPRS
jgi:hypothetical protein